jgi:hypothetical protein
MRLVLANMGIPMIAVEVPIMAMAFVPVILLEAFVFAKRLDVPYRRALKAVAAANVFSTVVGVPLAWFVMFLPSCVGGVWMRVVPDSPAGTILSVLGGSAWLGPISEKESWMIPTALLVLLVPTYFASVWLEWFAIERQFDDLPRARVKKAVWAANSASYLGLLLLGLWFLWIELHRLAP